MMADRTSSVLLKILEDDIDAGRLGPGDVLDEQMLANRFNVSRTPAREALLHLEAGRGPDDGCGAIALRTLQKSAKAMVKRLDSTAYIDANTAFHNEIYRGARNEFLLEQLVLTRRRMRSYHRSSLTSPARVRASFQKHAAIVDAIVTRDQASAQRAMRDHILSGGKVFADMIATAIPASTVK